MSCTASCWAMPECAACGLRKPPRGRSVPLEAANGYCGPDCEGYNQPPRPGHYWPGEEPVAIDECGIEPETWAAFGEEMVRRGIWFETEDGVPFRVDPLRDHDETGEAGA